MSKNIIYYLLVLLSFTACVNRKKHVYFHNTSDATITANVESLEPVIQKNDMLSITVSSLNPDASEIFNTPAGKGSSSVIAGSISESFGYLVDQDGNIQFPVLGNIKAAGLSKKSLRDTIYNQIIRRKLLLDPIVSVRYLNFRVSVLGEVAHPAVYNVPNEKVTLLEALGMAGDITIYGKKENVMLIRDENGVKTIKRLDLTKYEVLTSPYFYLKSNDVVYVEPTKAKIASTRNVGQWLPIIFSASSLIVVVVDKILK